MRGAVARWAAPAALLATIAALMCAPEVGAFAAAAGVLWAIALTFDS